MAPQAADARPSRSRRRVLLVLLAALVLVAGGSVLWHKAIDEQVRPKNFGLVARDEASGLAIYRSGQLSERMLRRTLRDRGIRTILDLSASPSRAETLMERIVAADLGVERHEFDLAGDGTGDPRTYARVLCLMVDPSKQPVLVHCAAGAQRTGVAVMLYRHLVEGRSIADANHESFDYRRDADDWKALAWLAEHLPEVEASFSACSSESAAPTDAPEGP
jgi:protein tyrosine/serine phosphatase